jgi:hypothetical protein
MKRVDRYAVEAFVLIGLGVLFLLQNLGVLGILAAPIWTLAFVAGGATFLAVYIRKPANWWALIPAFALLGIAAMIALSTLFPGAVGPWLGALFLGALSLPFWLIYLTGHERWWAIIPGGVLMTLALVAGLAETAAGPDLGWLFFLGLGVTFGVLALAPTPAGHIRWALVPAVVMLAMALLVFATTESLFNMLWPLLLIAGGIALIWRRTKGVSV